MASNSQEIGWSDYVALLRRRWRPTLLVFAVISLGTIYVAYSLPAVYQSSATVLIEQQGIPDEFVQTPIDAYAEQLLQTIYQRVVAAPRILDAIERFDLYPDDRNSLDEDELISLFRDSTEMTPHNITTVHARTGREAIITFGFQIAFLYENPVQARDVAQMLANDFVSENSQLRSEKAARATAFLDSEASGMEEDLAAVAQRIAQFKERNTGNLPEDQAVNLRTWERLREELTQVENNLRETREQKALLESEIIDTPRFRPVMDGSGDPVLGSAERLSEAQQELIRLRGRYSENHPEIVALRREIAALSSTPANLANLVEDLEKELLIKREQLANARRQYSDNHPDVLQLSRDVDSVSTQLRDVRQEIAEAGASGAAQPNNPIYMQLRTRIASAAAQIADLTRRQNELIARVDNLDRLRILAPEVERDYTALMQEQDVLLERYRTLRGLEGEAALGEALEVDESGQRLTIIEPARTPSSPISPNRVSLTFLGVVLAIAIGLGVASLAESMDTKVRGRRDIFQLLDAPPMGIIPYVESRADTVKRISLNAVFALGLLGGIVVVTMTVAS